METVLLKSPYLEILEKEVAKIDRVSDQIKNQFLREYGEKISDVISNFSSNPKIQEELIRIMADSMYPNNDTTITRALINAFSSKNIIDFVSRFGDNPQLAVEVINGLGKGINHNITMNTMIPDSQLFLTPHNTIKPSENSRNPVSSIANDINSQSLFNAITKYSNIPEMASVISLFACDIIRKSGSDGIDAYSARLEHQDLMKMLSGPLYKGKMRSEIGVRMAYILAHLENSDMIAKICSTLEKIPKSQSKSIPFALDRMYNVLTLTKAEKFPREKALDIVLKSLENNPDDSKKISKIPLRLLLNANFIEAAYETIQDSGIDSEMIELAGLYEKLVNDRDMQQSFKQLLKSKENAMAVIDQEFRNLCVKNPELLTLNEKKALISTELQRRIESDLSADEAGSRLWAKSFIKENNCNMNQFLDMRGSNFSTPSIKPDSPPNIRIPNEDKIIDIIKISPSENGLLRKGAMEMFVYGLNGSKSKANQTLSRQLLNRTFGEQKVINAIKIWKMVKKEHLAELIEAFDKLDPADIESEKKILDVFKKGLSKLPENSSRDLAYIINEMQSLLENGTFNDFETIIAYTIHGKDNIMKIDSGRVGACTFLDYPTSSWTVFNYAIDPGIVLLNFALSSNGFKTNELNLPELKVYGIAICAIGTFTAKEKNGTILFVDSIEGGIDFKKAIQGKENAIANSLVKLGREIGVDYIGFYTNPPNHTPRMIAKLIPMPTESVRLKLFTETYPFLDAFRNIPGKQKSGVVRRVKLVDLKDQSASISSLRRS